MSTAPQNRQHSSAGRAAPRPVAPACNRWVFAAAPRAGAPASAGISWGAQTSAGICWGAQTSAGICWGAQTLVCIFKQRGHLARVARSRGSRSRPVIIAGGTNDWQWTKITHQVDAIGRTSDSNYRQWLNGGSEPAGDSLQHVYDQAGRMVQNYDGTSAYGATWRWAGAANSHNGPLWGPAADTSSQVNHNVAAGSFKGIPVRRSFSQPTVEGDKRELFGQGRPQAKDSVSSWHLGIQSGPQPASLQGTTTSRFSFIGTVAATDMSRATDSREAGRIGIFGSALSYGGSYGRVTNEAIGRDVNPLGRSGGFALVGGSQNFNRISAVIPLTIRKGMGSGNSINNDGMPTPDCPDPECVGGGTKYWDKYAKSDCCIWHAKVWEHDNEWDQCLCKVRSCRPDICPDCSSSEWRHITECCYCMECKARNRADKKCEYPCKFDCAGPKWCQMPDDCYCQEKSDGGSGDDGGDGLCWIVVPGSKQLGSFMGGCYVPGPGEENDPGANPGGQLTYKCSVTATQLCQSIPCKSGGTKTAYYAAAVSCTCFNFKDTTQGTGTVSVNLPCGKSFSPSEKSVFGGRIKNVLGQILCPCSDFSGIDGEPPPISLMERFGTRRGSITFVSNISRDLGGKRGCC